jgi:hypothetical protein
VANKLGNANTPTGLTNAQLLGWIQQNAKLSSFINSHVYDISGSPSLSAVQSQLQSAGYSSGQISKILNAAPSEFQSILRQIGAAAVIPPLGSVAEGLGAGGTAATGAEGAAAGAGAGAGSAISGASTAAKLAGLAGLLGATGNTALVIRALEGLVGVALLFLGLQALTGTGTGNPVSAVKTATKAVR